MSGEGQANTCPECQGRGETVYFVMMPSGVRDVAVPCLPCGATGVEGARIPGLEHQASIAKATASAMRIYNLQSAGIAGFTDGRSITCIRCTSDARLVRGDGIRVIFVERAAGLRCADCNGRLTAGFVTPASRQV